MLITNVATSILNLEPAVRNDSPNGFYILCAYSISRPKGLTGHFSSLKPQNECGNTEIWQPLGVSRDSLAPLREFFRASRAFLARARWREFSLGGSAIFKRRG